MPEGHNADRLRKIILDEFDMSLGTGLTKLAGRVFRIGHLGDFNDLTLIGTLAGVEMGLELSAVPAKKEGVRGGDAVPGRSVRRAAGEARRGVSEESIQVNRDGAIANRRPEPAGQAQRADQGDVVRALAAAMRELRCDASVRCVVLRGAGERAFAAGADIAEFHAGAREFRAGDSATAMAIGWLRAVRNAATRRSR
jgi:hypothetical protein